MNPYSVRLAITLVMFFALLAFLSVGFGTLNHVEVELVGPDKTVYGNIRYGLFRECTKLKIIGEEKCKAINYNKIEEMDAHTLDYTYYDNDASTQIGLLVLGYAWGFVVSLALLCAFCCSVSGKFMFGCLTNFMCAGIIGICTCCVFTQSIIDAWENLQVINEVYGYEYNTKRSWSFFIYMAANSLMVLASIGGCFLTAGYSQNQRMV